MIVTATDKLNMNKHHVSFSYSERNNKFVLSVMVIDRAYTFRNTIDLFASYKTLRFVEFVVSTFSHKKMPHNVILNVHLQ